MLHIFGSFQNVFFKNGQTRRTAVIALTLRASLKGLYPELVTYIPCSTSLHPVPVLGQDAAKAHATLPYPTHHSTEQVGPCGCWGGLYGSAYHKACIHSHTWLERETSRGNLWSLFSLTSSPQLGSMWQWCHQRSEPITLLLSVCFHDSM